MRLTAVYDDRSLEVTFTFPSSERERAWQLYSTLNQWGPKIRSDIEIVLPNGDRMQSWLLPREYKDTLRKHLHSLDWPDLTWAFTEQPEAL